MLTVDLVRARPRKGKLHLIPLDEKALRWARPLAEAYLKIARDGLDQPRWRLEEQWDALDYPPWGRKIALGLRKLIEDRCTFAVPEGWDPPALRRAVFTRASQLRREDLRPFSREGIIDAVAAELGLTSRQLDAGLFIDLKKNHILTEFVSLPAEELLRRYELGQAQAVLLRAVRVRVQVRSQDPRAYRDLFRTLKFRRLLFRLEELDGESGYAIELDGPFSLFSSVTKYGLQLALMLPVLDRCEEWSLQSDVLWGKERAPLSFELQGPLAALKPGLLERPPEVETLLQRLRKADHPWRVEYASSIHSLPGVGLCVPDIVCTRPDWDRRILIEIMGYWSREAVWKRVDFLRSGGGDLADYFIFALSAHLRVSESVLDDDLPGEFYVYKKVINARKVLQLMDRIFAALSPATGDP